MFFSLSVTSSTERPSMHVNTDFNKSITHSHSHSLTAILNLLTKTLYSL